MGVEIPPLYNKIMAIIFQNGFGIGTTPGNGGGGGGPVVNCSPSSTFSGNLYFNNGTPLTWSDDTTGFSLYNGGFTNIDDGYSNTAIATLPSNFFMACTGSTSVFMSTNGFITIGVGSNNWSQSPQGNNPPIIGGNVGDLFINTGAGLSGGLTQGAYHKITNTGNYMKFELKVFEVMYQNQNHESSYQINLYKDSTYQWIETLTKDTSNYNYNQYHSNIGPTSSSDVSQVPSTTSSQVWRGDLSGTNWEYMGEGSVDTNAPSLPISGGTTTGGVTINSSYNPYGPGSSYFLDGTSGYITLTGNTDTAMGTGDFTVEWNQYETQHNSHPRIFAIGQYPSATMAVSLEGAFYMMENGSWTVMGVNYGTILNNWVHFAIVRIAGTTTIYKDGNSIHSFSDSNNLNNTSTNLNIGQESPASDSGAFFHGAITSFRWTKGLGIYTGNFQKPTGPLGFTASANPFGGSNTEAIPSGYVKYLLQP
jgi:uncharacterized membrane protein